MTTWTQCPECQGSLGKDPRKCRCGWEAPKEQAEARRAKCATPGCGEVALIRYEDENLCLPCVEGKHNTRSFERCKAMGLSTVEEMRAFCAKTFKSVGRQRPDFAAWAERIGQTTVDVALRMDTDSDRKLLERLRERCVIDAENKIIPLERRAAMRAEREARIQAERERVEALLAAQGVVRRPDVDAEIAT